MLFGEQHVVDIRGGCCCSSDNGECLFIKDSQDSLNGDTTIGSYTYQKLYLSYSRTDYINGTPNCPPGCSPSNTYYHSPSFEGAIRQDISLRKVFIFQPPSTQESLLYNFNLSLGDTLPVSAIVYSEKNYVSKIDSILVGGQYHKRFWLWAIGTTPPTSSDSGYVSIIEGIGSTFGLLTDLVPLFEVGCGLNCVKVNSIPVFPPTAMTCTSLITGIDEKENKFSFQISPNPFSKQTNIHTDKILKDATLTIFNFCGQQVKQMRNISGQTIILQRDYLPNGFYFLQLMQDNKTYTTDKLIIIGN